MLITCMKIKIAFANSFDHCQLQIELLIRVRGGKMIKKFQSGGAVLTFIQFFIPRRGSKRNKSNFQGMLQYPFIL